MTDRVVGPKPVREAIAIGAVLLLASLRFLSELHSGLGLSDEGHLWYATLRTSAGEIPIHDFRSYDPARYWWLAGSSRIFGDGIAGVRAGSALFALLGLGLGMLAARRGVKNPIWLFAAGSLCAAWMFPQHKLFEHGLILAALYAGVRFLERPTRGAHFGAGVFVGIAACFGRNHGVYLLVSFLLLILFVRIVGSRVHANLLDRHAAEPNDHAAERPGYRVARPARSLWTAVSWFGAGILIGYVPILVHLLLVDGFAHSFRESVLHGTGVLSKSVPWPWSYPYTRTAWLENFSGLLLGLAFLVVPLFYLCVGVSIVAGLFRDVGASMAARIHRRRVDSMAGIDRDCVGSIAGIDRDCVGSMAGIDRSRVDSIGVTDRGRVGSIAARLLPRFSLDPLEASRPRLLAVCIAVGLPYLHHAFGRADASHLAQTIHPFLIGSVSLALGGVKMRNWMRETGREIDSSECALGRKQRASIVVLAWVLLAYVGATTCVVFLTRSDLGERIRARSATSVAYEVGGDRLRLSPRERDYLQWVRDFVEQNVQPDENIYIGPYRAGLYAVLGRRSPVWETFFQWPVTDERQREMIRDFDQNHVNWAIVYTYAVDGRVERDPAHTMPLVWEYLHREFEPFPVTGLSKDHLCLSRRKQAS